MMIRTDKMNKVSIMEIERFAIHDGPGIRTTIFLQGCPLHCPWCANPESQVIGTHLMYDRKKCVGCGMCYSVCEDSAITFQDGRPVFHRENCTGCRKCSEVCVQNAIKISGEKKTVKEIIDVVLRDKDYYDNSGGGVTVSGGEPFVQFEGLTEIFKQCKEYNLHTAVETCGQVSRSKISTIFPLIDLFLFDVKHINKEKLKETTGGDLDLILGNLRYIAHLDPSRVIIRVPVLPGFNYEKDVICDIYYLALECGIKTVHLLPYHTLGKNKYYQLGREYTFACDSILNKTDLIPLKELGESMGLNIKIGG